MIYYWIDKGKGHDPRYFCPACGHAAGFYTSSEKVNGNFVGYINRFCGVCGTRLHYPEFGFQKENEPKEKKCGDCAKFEGCKEYTTEEETFPEVGGCKAFKRKETTDADTV